MTDKRQSDALHLAALIEKTGARGSLRDQAAAELRRQHVELETLRAKLKTYEDLGDAGSDVQLLRTGYAAARLEIESLRKEHADELAVAYMCGASRGKELAAQQPGAAYAALPDADRDYMRKVVAVAVTMLFDGYKEDVMRVFSTGELSEFVTITAAMRVEQVEDIYRRAWDLLSLPARASHGQAQAQAAPAAVAGPSDHELDSLVQKYFGWQLTVSEANHRAFAREVLAQWGTAPTTQPAPQQAAQGPAAYGEKWDAELGRTAMRFVDRAGDVHPGIDDAEAICAEFHKAMSDVIDRMPHVKRMQPSMSAPAAQGDALDAARWRMLPAFFEEYQIDAMKLYRDIDAARAAQEGK